MKKIILEFLRRGFAACGLDPVVLGVLYLIMQCSGAVEMLTIKEVCVGLFPCRTLLLWPVA